MKFNKIIILFLVLVSFISVGFSYTEIDSCQTINSSFVFDLDREIRINTSISTVSGNCLTIDVNNISLNCDNYQISGVGTDNGIFTGFSSNISIENCKIKSFQTGIFSFNFFDSNLINIEIENTTNGIRSGLEMKNSNFENITIINIKGVGFDFDTLTNSLINNIHVENISDVITNYAFEIKQVSNSVISNFYIKNISTSAFNLFTSFSGKNNVTIKNGVIDGSLASFGVFYARSLTFFTFDNLTIFGNSEGPVFYLSDQSGNPSYNNTFINLNLYDNEESINLYGSNYNNYFENNIFGDILYVQPRSEDGPYNNYFNNNEFKDSLMFLNFSGVYASHDNYFYNNTFTNTSGISFINSPNNYFNYSGYGNKYDSSLINSSGCIIGSNVCDPFFSLYVVAPVVSSSVSVNSLPSFGVSSVFIVFGLIGLFLI